VLDWFGFPTNLVNLIMGCVSSSRLVIKMNGRQGSVYIMPDRGLKQGCPLSPYLFILVMEVLSRMLMEKQRQGSIKGVVLATGAPAITHSLYADDLVLFGTADSNEVEEFENVMHCFGQMCGLRLNNSKSVVWFSKRVTSTLKYEVLRRFPAQEPDDCTTYLGYPVPKGKVYSRHYKGMKNRVGGKCSG
jgi:Reverse transcriptase (RNA-dependent DNA polymerase)